jgi:hypothetical protein
MPPHKDTGHSRDIARSPFSRAFTNVPRLIRRGVNLAPVRKHEEIGHCWLTDSPARTDWRSLFIAPCASLFFASRTSLRHCL